MAANPDPKLDPDVRRMRGWIDLAVGLVLVAVGAILFTVTYDDLAHETTTYLVSYVPLLAGGSTAIRGMWRLLAAPITGAVPIKLEVRGLGYKSFVAWRYLLVSETKVTRTTTRLLATGIGLLGAFAVLRAVHLGPQGLGWRDPLLIALLGALGFVFAVMFWGVLRHSKAALIACIAGLSLAAVAGLGTFAFSRLALVQIGPEQQTTVLQALNIAEIVGMVLAGLSMFFGCLRAFFTFFTTVPIGGVWVGTSALVIVLAVMSGFETDLREKIVGSNAHLQITRPEGEFVQWRDIKAKLDKLPGVVASTPFVVSEVVVAANNQGMNVIIKGIDPETVGDVTDLLSALARSDPRGGGDLRLGQEAMQRLEPTIVDTRDLSVPQQPRTGPVIDPPPDDMPTPGDPIDFSGAPDASPGKAGGGRGGSASAGSSGGSADKPAGGSDIGAGSRPGAAAREPELSEPRSADRVEPPEPFGGDAQRLFEPVAPLDEPVTSPRDVERKPRVAGPQASDPPPGDLLTSDEPPADYSRPDYGPDTVVTVSDMPFEPPAWSRRTQSLPGILVGKELAKQTHLQVGQEVRVVSPLSDPSNPDATGTPIPFNRDYRVAGTFFTGMYEYDLKYVYVTMASLQSFLDRHDAIDGIEVRLTNPDDTDVFIATFHSVFGPSYRLADWKEINRSLFSALKLEKIAMFLVLGIVILVASFSIIGNLIMVVVEKAREIALLKTLGASDVGVMQLFATQGLMIGLIGTALGIATGLLCCSLAKRFGLPLNPDVYYIDRLPIHVDPMSVVAAASAGILISIAATLYPAVVAARVRPAAGMRH